MKKTDGSDRAGRLERVTRTSPPAIINGSILSLTRKALAIATSMRYYGPDNLPSGYFDEVLSELKQSAETLRDGAKIVPNGKMEPSAALLTVFIENLHIITQKFNERWAELPFLYINDILRVKDQEPLPYRLWVGFTKNVQDTLTISKGRKFTLNCPGNDDPVILELKDDIELGNVSVKKICSVLYNKQRNLYPAARLGYVTSLEIKDLLTGSKSRNSMFAGKKDMSNAKSPGLIISSPELLLREGKRSVTMRLETESTALTDLIERLVDGQYAPFTDMTRETIFHKLLDNIFHITISTAHGWNAIDNVTVKKGDIRDNTIIVKMFLPEDFPPTEGCATGTHGISSRFPAIKIHLNLDAWLYPYSWIKNFMLKRAVIETRVYGVSSILVYNELGRIDNSKPFAPFGTNTERGAWMALGNYEMAVKNSLSFDLNIQWEQLPDNNSGLYGHYLQYGENIDNSSFKTEVKYLSDYQWHSDPEQPLLPLFGSVPPAADGSPLKEAPLSKESVLRNISLRKMPRTNIEEQAFDYNINMKTGFANIILSEPPIGFGEKRYRELFTEMIIKKSLKKTGTSQIPAPIVPLVERLTIDYNAFDKIDLRSCRNNKQAAIWHIYPMGIKKIYPNNENRSVPLIYAAEEDASLAIGLDNINGGEHIKLYFEFAPMSKKIGAGSYPVVRWYWGNGYSWSPIPDDVLIDDSTRNLCMNGCIELRLPDKTVLTPAAEEGLLWLKAAVTHGHQHIPELVRVHVNAAELVITDATDDAISSIQDNTEQCSIEPLKNIPGLKSVEQISAIHDGRSKESGLNKLMRVSEYVTHRGKAVTARDFELLVMEAFPEVAKIKCLTAPSPDGTNSRNITLAGIPTQAKETKKGWRPKLPSSLMLKIGQHLKEHCSAYVSGIEVINPYYEEIMIRCDLTFKRSYSLGSCRSMLREACNRLIAPWQEVKGVPSFGQELSMDETLKTIISQEYVDKVDRLNIIRISRSPGKGFTTDEYLDHNDIVSPGMPHSVFVPAAEHLFICDGMDRFGLGEMTVGHTLVIKKNETKTL